LYGFAAESILSAESSSACRTSSHDSVGFTDRTSKATPAVKGVANDVPVTVADVEAFVVVVFVIVRTFAPGAEMSSSGPIAEPSARSRLLVLPTAIARSYDETWSMLIWIFVLSTACVYRHPRPLRPYVAA
jgi:hypothetical protein